MKQEPAITAAVATIRPLQERDLPDAERIMRLAFGTFLGLPDPLAFASASSYIAARWRADPRRAFVAESDGAVVGSNVATRWGSVGFFGPLTVHPDFWNRGIGSLLMEPILDCFSTWDVRHAGLFTFAHSPRHLALYQKYGFYPRFLTALLSKPAAASKSSASWSRYSALPESERASVLEACREVTEAIYEGLEFGIEIRAVYEQQLGETVLLWQGSRLVGVACCHYGQGSEADAGAGYIKAGAVLPGADAAERFSQLLQACDDLAAEQGLSSLVAGVNLARDEAYRQLLALGFRVTMTGVAMERPNEAGYNHSGTYLIDDWR